MSIGRHFNLGRLQSLTKHRSCMIFAQLLGNKLMLGSNIVIEQDIRPGSDLRSIARTRRLPISEQSGDDNEILVWVQSLVFSDEPFVIADQSTVPGRIDDQRLRRVSECLVSLNDIVKSAVRITEHDAQCTDRS